MFKKEDISDSYYAHGFLKKEDLGDPEEIVKKGYVEMLGKRLEVVDMTYPLHERMPIYPSGGPHPIIVVQGKHAKELVHGHLFTIHMHMGTHTDAPIHVEAGYPTIDVMPLDKYIGKGVVISIPKKKWEKIMPKDLEKVTPKVEKGDIVIINSGWHRYYGDNITYFCHAPGLYKEAAEWFVAKEVKAVGVDQPAMDHPLGTRLVQTLDGSFPPFAPWLIKEYKQETGKDVYDDFPYWEPSHRILYTHGIPGCENVGGDIDKATGKRCTIAMIPLNILRGDASLVRVVAMLER